MVVSLEELENIIKKSIEEGEETLAVKPALLSNLIELIKIEQEKSQILLVQEYNLVTALKERNVSDEEIKEILKVVKE